MFDRWLGFKVHHYLQALGLLILAVGLPLNKVLMSIGSIWLAANILIKADFSSYWKNWKNNLIFRFILGVFLCCLFGLIYTSHYDYAFHYINSILPLFVVPISLIAYPVKKNWIPLVLYGFLASLLVTSLINFSYILNHPFANYRSYSQFGSHIRYALCIAMGCLICLYFILHLRSNIKWLFLPLLVWFLYYTYISKVDSGYIAILMVFLAFFIYLINRIKNRGLRFGISSVVLIVVIISVVKIGQYLAPSKVNWSDFHLSTRSATGELYHNDTTVKWFENGYPIQVSIAPKELECAWNRRSKVDYRKKIRGYPIKNILIRYMTSIGITKDSVGMTKMSAQDIQNVENGMVSINQTYGKIHQRLANLKNQLFNYYNGGDPDGNSLLQRFEHWKAATQIIKNNWIIGVGTGDVQTAFNQTYKKEHSRLSVENRKRAHNQFLTFWITFGIVGFILFLGFWLLFIYNVIRINHLLGMGFAFISIASFLTEDTIETQEGVTFISLFLGITAMLLYYQQCEKK